MPRKPSPRTQIKNLNTLLKQANDQVAALMKEREEAFNAKSKVEREFYIENDAARIAQTQVRERDGQIARLREDTAYLKGKVEELRTIMDRLIPMPVKTDTTTRITNLDPALTRPI